MEAVTLQKELTDEDLRVRVASLNGWTFTKVEASTSDYVAFSHPDKPRVMRFYPKGSGSNENASERMDAGGVPDYPTDLNACSEFEKSMECPETSAYAGVLREVVALDNHIPNDSDCVSDYWLICASPRQRCLAFLKTKGAL